ncbi:hypothetical protein [Brevundimonas sp.]|jgi:hypothetical protein|uniref:hypothetical protein n=1 Tax=Brevundimonas sp. TaxID=1871086 RepID=UPI0017F5A865|nr:hypothetical protein [Brevundimonas sp.]MBA4806141.1 hypothetical protein [Brevundimonas sp.]
MTPYDLTLDEMLADPMVRQLMDRDGVMEDQIRRLSDHVRRRPGPAAGPRGSDLMAAREPRSFAP